MQQTRRVSEIYANEKGERNSCTFKNAGEAVGEESVGRTMRRASCAAASFGGMYFLLILVLAQFCYPDDRGHETRHFSERILAIKVSRRLYTGHSVVCKSIAVSFYPTTKKHISQTN